jgi:hypothetical protein
MDNRLFWRGYTTHNLDDAAQAFSLYAKAQPEFFAARENWQCGGSEEHKAKMVYTDMVPCLGVYIPTILTMEEFLKIESAWTEKRSTAPSHFESRAQEELDEEYATVTTYCNFCLCPRQRNNPLRKPIMRRTIPRLFRTSQTDKRDGRGW